MNIEKLKVEVRKLEFALNLAEQNSDIDRFLADDVWHLIDCINQLDEQQKVIVPQFVADYIERWKCDELSLNGWFTFDYGDDGEAKVAEWLMVDINDETKRHREFTLIDAIRYGYKVEKEKNYEVIIGRGTKGGYPSVVVLYKSVGESMVLKELFEEDYEDSKQSVPSSFWLTEKEIKDYDKRYWVFAEEVTQ